jgi:DNA-binding transcriptional MerR regulator
MAQQKIPEKLIYKLEDVSRLSGVDPATIEAWEKEFPFLRAGLTGTGKKVFRQKDLDIIVRVKELLQKKGFTIAGARRRIEEEFGTRQLLLVPPDRLRKVLQEVRDELEDISRDLASDPKKK